MYRVGQNHIYMAYIRYSWLENHQIYGVCIRVYTVLANPSYVKSENNAQALETIPPINIRKRRCLILIYYNNQSYEISALPHDTHHVLQSYSS